MLATATDYVALLAPVQTEALLAVTAGIGIGIAIFAVRYGPKVVKSVALSLAGR